MRRWLWVTGGILFFAGGISAFDVTTARGDQPAALEAPVGESPAAESLRLGLELEQQRQWLEAVQHYEAAVRKHPDESSLKHRLLISRIHHDVHRRFQDESYQRSIRQMGALQALDLYDETLANIETHYVDSLDWGRLARHGSASLEVALTEPLFIDSMLKDADPAAVERFRLSVHKQVVGRQMSARNDLRLIASQVANLAKEEISLDPTAVVMEFTCGAITALDAYSRFLTPGQLEETFSSIEGNFVGLGIELKAAEDRLQVINVIAGGPASEAGIVPGDTIVQVDQTKTADVTPDHAADLLRGPEGSQVGLVVVDPAGKSRSLWVPRRRVDVPCVENVHLVDPAAGIAYLRLTSFQKTTTRELEKALWDLHQQGMKSLIIDVRGNPGGLLTAAVEVADRFLATGRIVTTRGRNTRENFDYTAHRTNTWNVPLTVLIDSDSASASEIFAGAINDHDRGQLVGETSYGKGSVQGIFRLQAANCGLCLTTAKFYSPSGQAISERGVKPDVAVEPSHIAARPNDQGQITSDADDRVLQTAIEAIRGDARLSSLAR